jgi:hypothetical protein
MIIFTNNGFCIHCIYYKYMYIFIVNAMNTVSALIYVLCLGST